MHVILFTIALLTSATAMAQEEPHATIDQEELARARGIFEAGRVAYDDGRYDEALSLFRSCYSITNHPALLYNIAMSADRLRHDDEALQAYEQYLPLADPDQRDGIAARIDALRRSIAEHAEREQVADPAPPMPAPPPVSEPVYPPVPEILTTPDVDDEAPNSDAGFALLFGSSALAVGGGVLTAFGVVDWTSVEGAVDGTVWSEREDAYNRSQTMVPIGAVLATAGVIGIVVAIAILMSESK
jgi:tetratricopeptide (TPR) repeat protein